MDDCWALGAMMEYDNQAVTRNTYLACVYCATYQAIADFFQQFQMYARCRSAMDFHHLHLWTALTVAAFYA